MYETVNNELLSVSNDDEICKIEQKFTECQIYRQIYVWKRRGRRRRRMRSCPDDDDEQTKEKNYRLIYLIYYYSCLLNNAKDLPYPMFLFVQEWMMQNFGGFQ